MNDAFPDVLYNGVLLCTSIYLIVLAVVNFFSNRSRFILLGLLCFLMGVTLVNNIFWPVVKKDWLLSLLLGSGKNVFIGPLIFLYLSTWRPRPKNVQHSTLTHMMLPVMLHFTYYGVKFIFPEYYALHYVTIATMLLITESLLLVFYSVLSVKLLATLQKQNGTSVKTNRIKLLLYLLLFYFLSGKTYDLASIMFASPFWSTAFLSINRYFFMPMVIFVNGSLIVYTVLEMKWVRPVLFGKGRHDTRGALKNSEKLDALFQKYFGEEKLYTNEEISISYLSKLFGIPPQSIRHYLRHKFNMGFKDYINQKRVEELKRMLHNEEWKTYSLIGMANTVGFRSPATFYRIFKKYTGMTPLQYQQRK